MISQGRIALAQGTGVALPGIPVSVFHVKQRPVKRLSSVARTPVQDVGSIPGHEMNRKTAGKIGKPSQGAAFQVNIIGPGPTLYPDGDDPTIRQTDMSDHAKGRLPMADELIGMCCSKGTDPPETVHGLQQTGLARCIGAGDQVQAGGKGQSCGFDISELSDIESLQSRG
jgi:hypothetical protein